MKGVGGVKGMAWRQNVARAGLGGWTEWLDGSGGQHVGTGASACWTPSAVATAQRPLDDDLYVTAAAATSRPMGDHGRAQRRGAPPGVAPRGRLSPNPPAASRPAA